MIRSPHRKTTAPAALAVALLLSSCGLLTPPEPTEDEKAAYAEELAAWQKEREEGLRDPDGWLTLAGLDWLRPGDNRVGSAPDSEVVLPPSAPPHVGTIHLVDGTVEFEANPGVPVTSDGDTVAHLRLASDANGAEPTVLRLGAVSFFVIDRGGKLGVRVRDGESATLADFHGLEYYPADLGWKKTARFEPYDPPKRIPITNILGMVEEVPSPGALAFDVGGETYRLDALPEDEESLFVLFADATNGHGTYGAGRYVYPAKPGPDGTTVLDFNHARNPPCAFTEFATCPLPPPQNHLPFAVEAGEKYAGDH